MDRLCGLHTVMAIAVYWGQGHNDGFAHGQWAHAVLDVDVEWEEAMACVQA